MRLALVTSLVLGLPGPGCVVFSDDGGPGPAEAGIDLTSDAGSCLDHISASSEANSRLSAAYASPCTVDTDCAIHAGRVDCPDGGVSSGTGEIAYSIHQSDEFQSAWAAEYQDFGVPECLPFHLDYFYFYAYCRDGVCRGSERRPDRYCPGGLSRIAEASDALDELGVETHCTDVSDCTLVATEIDCEASANRFVGCPIAVQAGQEQSLLTVLHDVLLPSYCSDSGFTCDEVADCPLVELACLGSVCTAVEVVMP